MAFDNDYLTDVEKEIFKERAIPTVAFWKSGILGYELSGKLKSTLDREEHIYLFDLGRHHDAHEPDDFHFALVWDSLSKDEAIHISVKMKSLSESIPVNGCDVLWHSLNLGLPEK